jgi:hypothetical protein
MRVDQLIIGKTGSLPVKDAHFGKKALKILALENYHPKIAPLQDFTMTVSRT